MMKVGTEMLWLTAPKCGCRLHDGRRVSFRRLLPNGYAEVYTCSGSQNVPLANLVIR